jgi:hypothetical protein
MLFEPLGGAEVNVIVLPETVNAEAGFCGTFSTTTCISYTEPTVLLKVNAVVEALPLK